MGLWGAWGGIGDYGGTYSKAIMRYEGPAGAYIGGIRKPVGDTEIYGGNRELWGPTGVHMRL